MSRVTAHFFELSVSLSIVIAYSVEAACNHHISRRRNWSQMNKKKTYKMLSTARFYLSMCLIITLVHPASSSTSPGAALPPLRARAQSIRSSPRPDPSRCRHFNLTSRHLDLILSLGLSLSSPHFTSHSVFPMRLTTASAPGAAYPASTPGNPRGYRTSYHTCPHSWECQKRA